MKKKSKLFSYFNGLKFQAFLAPFFKLLEAIFELLVPFIVSDIMNVGVENGDTHYIIVRFIVLVVFAFCGLGFALTAQYFSSYVANKYACRLRQGVFEHVQTLSFKDLDTLGNSTILTRMTSDVNQIQSGINMFLRLFLRSPFIVFGALVMALIIDSQIGIVFAVVIPILFLVVFLIMRFTLPRYNKIQLSLDNLTKETRENLTGVRVIRAFTGEEKQISDFEKKNQHFTSLQFAVSKISSLMNPLTVAIINIGVISILYFGGIKVNTGSLTSGEVFALYNYITYILVELIKFANLIINISKSIACSKRINALFEVEPSLKFKEHVKINDDYLTFDNVSFKYNKDGKEAITEYEVIKENKLYSLLKINIKTGRKNQIRVHMKSINHPIVGDKKYGSKKKEKRLYLHANILELRNPITGKIEKYSSKIPEQFNIKINDKSLIK